MHHTGLCYIRGTHRNAAPGHDRVRLDLRAAVRHLRRTVWDSHLLLSALVDAAATTHAATACGVRIGVATRRVHRIDRGGVCRARGRVRAPRGGTTPKSVLVVDVRCVLVVCLCWLFVCFVLSVLPSGTN